MLLSRDEQAFVDYWKVNRTRRKRLFLQLAWGLPLGVVLVIAIFVNFFSGWYKRAEMARNEATRQHDGSLMLVLVVAALLIVAFIIIFSARHKWDINEQRYRELTERADRE